jgi:hypothetical protein
MGALKIIEVWFVIILFASVAFTTVPGTMADKGGVSVSQVNIPLSEPEQKAIICWDGEEELLILSTDIKADENTKALEILPLPSEPDIKTMNETVFSNLKEMIEDYGHYEDTSKGLGGDSGDDEELPDIRIVFNKRLGVHNITVIEAFTTTGFAQFVSNFMEAIGLEPMSFPAAESLAASYMARNINYFVLDVVDLSTSLQSPQPLMYRFASDSVYYPMEITSLTGGESHILLFILHPYDSVGEIYETSDESFFNKKYDTWLDEKIIDIKKPDSPVDFERIVSTDVNVEALRTRAFSWDEDEIVDHDMYELYDFFKETNSIKIQVYEYEGPVVMEGDIDIGNYSVIAHKIDTEYEVKGLNLVLLTLVPPLIIVALIVIVIIYTGKKKKSK